MESIVVPLPQEHPVPSDPLRKRLLDTLQVQLIIGLDRDKTHVLPLDGLRDRLCVDEVVLVRLHEGLHELSWYQLDIVTLLPQRASEKVRSGAGLKPNQRCREVRGIDQKLLPVELLPHDHLTGSAKCYEMKGCLT